MKKKRILLIIAFFLAALPGAYFIWQIRFSKASDRMKLPPGQIVRVDANLALGFFWPYYLYIPDKAQARGEKGEPVHLLVFPNNTGEPSDDLAVHDGAALRKIGQVQELPERLGVPLLIPVFPRPWKVYMEQDLYVHALDRNTLETDLPDLKRVDLQLIAMMDDASTRLRQQGWDVNDHVLIMGFSASGMFANRFVVLHPERILAAAIGSPGGWPIAPVAEWQGKPLNYPLGINDLQALTGQAFDTVQYRSVRQFFFLGDQDDNDAVDWENQAYLSNLFGSTPVERWPHAEEIYHRVNADVRFVLEPGVGHTVSAKTWKDQIEFFAEAIADDIQTSNP
jgi:pimeloyl-ACP methyl ester carboxylesterase